MLLVEAQHLFIHSTKVVSPGWLLIDNGQIVEWGEGNAPGIQQETETIRGFDKAMCFSTNCSRFWVCPGFVDIHNHGIGGAEKVTDYWFSDYTVESIWKTGKKIVLMSSDSPGTTSCLASVTFPDGDQELTRRVLLALKDKCGKVGYCGSSSAQFIRFSLESQLSKEFTQRDQSSEHKVVYLNPLNKENQKSSKKF